MSKAYFEQDINNRMEELDSSEDVLCIGALTLSAFSSSARAAMLTQHTVQALVPDKPEVPGVSTGYEYMFGKYSTSYKTVDTKLKVIKKINKYKDYVYTLVVYDTKNNRYDIIQRNEVKNMAETYGFKYNNSVIDSYDEGDTIPKDTCVYKAPVYDEYGNFMYGVNAKIGYIISQETIEDAVVISESFADKLSTTKVESIEFTFNDNDIPLNTYGDNSNYKTFPDIGEYTKKSILCASRRKNKVLDQLNLKNKNLRKLFPDDDKLQTHGNWQIVDFNIWSNKDYDDVPDLPAYAQLKSYYKKNIDYYTEIYDTFGKIIESGSSYSQEFSRLYAKARDFLDPAAKYIDDGKMFSNMIVEFTVCKSEKLHEGCKICGRYGNKSVISKILPDEEMGITDEGVVPDMYMDSLGVLGRLNSGQSICHEISWVADHVLKLMKSQLAIDDKYELLFRFYDIVEKDVSKELKDHVASMTLTEKVKYMEDIENERIYVMQSPMNCITGDDLYALYDEFSPNKVHINFIDETGMSYKTLGSMIIADEYIMRLKQEPYSKYSVRSKSLINPRSFLPIKSTRASKHKQIYPDQSNKIGKYLPGYVVTHNCNLSNCWNIPHSGQSAAKLL